MLTVISVKWFCIIDIIVEIKLDLLVQYEPENVDVNKVYFAKYMFFFISITFISIPSLSLVKKISIY